jgi:proline iminopeptidase
MKKNFNPALPTLIYFVGGPGGTSRGIEFSLPTTNVIFFEQRGISCSRPATRKLFLDPKFYSSENTAADALLILDAYEIKKASLYGHSYGTVPATIFASKYPERTNSLILEGVVFKADESLWISPRKVKYMQDFFDSLPKEKQDRIISFSERSDVAKTWFSLIARMTLGVGNFVEGLNGFLDSTVFAKDSTDLELAEQISSMIPKIDITTPAEQNGFGEITMGMISCQEMNMTNTMMSHLLYFKDRKLVPDRMNIDYYSMCIPLGLSKFKKDFYTAEKYPIHVPVTYFLGEFDPATSLDQGLAHFKNAQSSNKQALVLLGGGHTPNIEKVIESSYCKPEVENCEEYKQRFIQVNIFEMAVRGLKISAADIEKLNYSGPAQWIVK